MCTLLSRASSGLEKKRELGSAPGPSARSNCVTRYTIGGGTPACAASGASRAAVTGASAARDPRADSAAATARQLRIAPRDVCLDPSCSLSDTARSLARGGARVCAQCGKAQRASGRACGCARPPRLRARGRPRMHGRVGRGGAGHRGERARCGAPRAGAPHPTTAPPPHHTPVRLCATVHQIALKMSKTRANRGCNGTPKRVAWVGGAGWGGAREACAPVRVAAAHVRVSERVRVRRAGGVGPAGVRCVAPCRPSRGGERPPASFCCARRQPAKRASRWWRRRRGRSSRRPHAPPETPRAR